MNGGTCSNELYAPREAFRRSLHAELTKSCASCHGNTPSAPYSFAATDPTGAYADAQAVVNFSNVSDSEIVKKVERERHNCGSDANCALVAASFKQQIQRWWDLGENPSLFACDFEDENGGGGNNSNSPSGPSYKTRALPIPSNLSKTQDTLLTFDLSQATPAIPSAHLRVGVRRLVDAALPFTLGSFQLRDIRLATSNKKYRISRIEIVLNNHETSYLNWSGISFVVAPQTYQATGATWPFFRMSTKTVDPLFENATGDTLAFNFDIEETPDSPSPDPGNNAPPDQQVFNTQISPILNNRCLNCHGANRAFNLSGSIDQDRTAAISFSNKANPAASTLYLKGTGTNHGGGNALSITAERDAIRNWMSTIP